MPTPFPTPRSPAPLGSDPLSGGPMRARIVTLCAAPLALALAGAAPAHPALAHPASAGGSSRHAENWFGHQAHPLAHALARAARTSTRFAEVPLVSDVVGKAAVTDPKLVNPWGLAMGATLWVSNAGTGTATVYTGGAGTAKKAPTTVAIPGGTPTGQVAYTGNAFTIKGKTGTAPASFVFSSPSGAITAWSAKADPDNAVIAAFTRGADYKGLALMNTNRGTFLLAPSFSHRRVHVFDEDFRRVRLSDRQFRDPSLPARYSPFNVEIVGDSVMVAYARRDPGTGKPVAGRGNGFVSVFAADGRFVRRLASRGPLNAPWAMTLAPQGFGAYAGALLVGNFGDGWINAYNPRTGRYLGPLRRADGGAIALEGLWDLEPGTAGNGGTDAVWFSAGISKARHGLLGLIRPAGATPAPAAARPPSPSPSSSATHRHGGGYGY
ncbi:TIGR03118 family protein [Microbispora cellulosiformans]|uniref:TIGR03118 family protein n=2 Tax=Microbispora cellulosiformans TaxID=2614688 RepID=A0A5J5K6W4_9ACTN|nr:TIGR03118 family protein [Microbispora cellulosiformans]